MKSLVATVVLVCAVAYSRAETSDEYNAKFEAAFAEAAAQGAVFEESYEAIEVSNEFNCEPYGPSDSVPTSVHRLRPGDIKVVAAIGDSLTAAQGAKASSAFTVFTNYRGVAFTIGGDGGSVLTIPNFIKKYNPEVFGASLGTGGENSANSKLNVAVSGAKAEDIPSQAVRLVEKLKEEGSKGNINYNKDWKLVTIFIGANDLCAYCKNGGEGGKYSSQKYKEHVKETLDILKEIPRTYVSLVNILDINPLAELSGLVCGIVKLFACDCAGKDNNKDAPKSYQEALQKLVEEEYGEDDDFTVVLQPLLEDYIIPRDSERKIDKGYFAPDCFHFNQKAHGRVAIGLWNNMIEPYGDKTNDWDVADGQLKCPAKNHCLTTKFNGDGSACATSNSFTANAATSKDSSDTTQDQEGSGSSYSIIVSTSTVAVAVCVMTVLLATLLVALRVRRGSGKTVEELPLVKSHA